MSGSGDTALPVALTALVNGGPNIGQSSTAGGAAGSMKSGHIDWSLFTNAQLQALAKELDVKNGFLALENSLLDSYFARSNNAGSSGASGRTADLAALSEGQPAGAAAFTAAADLGAIAAVGAASSAAGAATAAAAAAAAATATAAATAPAAGKRKRGANVKQVVDVQLTLTADQKAEIATRELEELRDNLDHRRSEWSRTVDNLRAEMEEMDISLQEVTRASYEFTRDIVNGARSEWTGKVLAERLLRYWEDAMRARDTTLEKIRLKNATLKTHKNKLMLQLRQKEEMGEVLHAIDFDQLKIENHQYQAKIEERNSELLKLKLVAGNIVQVLNFYKKKLGTLEDACSKLSTEIQARQDLRNRLSTEAKVVERDTGKAEKLNQQLVASSREFTVPSVMEYVNLKAEQQELYAKARSWRRKVEIAQISLQRQQRLDQLANAIVSRTASPMLPSHLHQQQRAPSVTDVVLHVPVTAQGISRAVTPKDARQTATQVLVASQARGKSSVRA
ncbi:hypothetical protein BC828DRAFT_396411 [Blastocladiella britannica]|nr:hypothetical protein BC828DRAFT_396411 [Blastocladiella britannica]